MNLSKVNLLPSIIFIAALFGIVLTSYRIFNYFYSLHKLSNNLLQKELKDIKYDSNLIAQFFNQIQEKTLNLLSQIKSNNIDKDKFATLSRPLLKEDKNIFGLGIIKNESSGFLVLNRSANQEIIDLKNINKNEFSYEWSGPFYSDDYKTYFIRFALPINQESNFPIVFIDVSYDSFKDLVLSFDIGAFGAIAIIMDDGKFFFHTYEKLAKTHVEFYKIPHYQNNLDLSQFFKDAASGKDVHILFYNPIVGRDVFALSKKINFKADHVEKSKTYSLIFFVAKDDIFTASTEFINRNFMRILISLVITLILLSFFIFGAYNSHFYCSINWARSIIAIFLFFIGVIWYHTYYSDIHINKENVFFIDLGFMKKVREKTYEKLPENFKEDVIDANLKFIPLGINIRNLEFPDSSHIQINGYMWAEFPKDSKFDIKNEVLFPDSIHTKDMALICELEEDDKNILVWNFVCILTQDTTYYYQYPLDKNHIKISILPRHIGDFIFVPSFNDYFYFTSLAKPGLIEGLDVPGWDAESSFFSYEKLNFKSDLGQYYLERNHGEIYGLVFNIALKRQLLDSVLSVLFPLLVALFILFIVLVLKKSSEIISSVSALFFVILYGHMAVRTKLSYSGIAYIEYFFIFAYLMMYFVVISQVLLSSNFELRLLKYRDNLFTKVFYWPVFFGLCFIVTVWIFFKAS